MGSLPSQKAPGEAALMGSRTNRKIGVGSIRTGRPMKGWAEREPRPDWVVLQAEPGTGRRTGLYHLKQEAPAVTTLCGLEKGGWQRWPPGLSRPPVEMCCRRCMKVVTKRILEGRYEHR
jgi:hypothetical protein